ncbi:hypothetical protein AUP68_12201 [Ilyonectria robusta]
MTMSPTDRTRRTTLLPSIPKLRQPSFLRSALPGADLLGTGTDTGGSGMHGGRVGSRPTSPVPGPGAPHPRRALQKLRPVNIGEGNFVCRLFLSGFCLPLTGMEDKQASSFRAGL